MTVSLRKQSLVPVKWRLVVVRTTPCSLVTILYCRKQGSLLSIKYEGDPCNVNEIFFRDFFLLSIDVMLIKKKTKMIQYGR